ncbi:hypothetical protein K492DRAFT_150842 [Lichtheimia hyalospora FSU 10163]|nr:hypothetical protein K492DRAFT_150842 [Lichtheimia hyalospora FSU 10163]
MAKSPQVKEDSIAEHHDDPDQLFVEASVAEVRAIEQRTRADIETQKQELRSMVGEQYLELISAADAIVAMNKNAHAVLDKLDSMQTACDISTIKKRAATVRSDQDEKGHNQKRQHLFALAALIKSLADVPEQIWHALENHRYLHAARLYAIAKRVHDTDMGFVDVQAAFPVVQRQWDAVSFFLPQIIQKSTAFLRIPDQTSESVAEILLSLMLLDGQVYLGTMEQLLEIRMAAINDMVSSKEHRLPYQLKEIIQLVQRTLVHVYEIYLQQPLLVNCVDQLQDNFMMGSSSSTLPAITRVFAPSTNVHLLMRYLPENVQSYTPHLETGQPLLPGDIRQFAQAWIQNVEELLEGHLDTMLEQADTHQTLIQIRSRVWDLLETAESNHRRSGIVLETKGASWKETCEGLLERPYSLWDNMLRDPFNRHARKLIDTRCQALAEQPHTLILKRVQAKEACPVALDTTTLPLPTSSSSDAIQIFIKSLSDASQGRHRLIQETQAAFDDALQIMRNDVEHHMAFSDKHSFQCKTDTASIKEHFESTCANAISEYTSGLRKLLDELHSWTDEKAANDMGIFIGRLAHAIAISSKELPRALTLSKPSTHSTLELRSGIDKDPRVKRLQDGLIDTYHQAHNSWITMVSSKFGHALQKGLSENQWNDQCAAALLWNNVGEDVHLPIQATNGVAHAVYQVCQELRRVNSTMLDKTIMQALKKHLTQTMTTTFQSFKPELTEKGAIQLIFDIYFANLVLQDGIFTEEMKQCIENTKAHIDPINWATFEPHFAPSVERFCLKQTLILGILTRPNRETYERTRKTTATSNQQHNVVPLAPQAPRFTLLPIGHLSLRA